MRCGRSFQDVFSISCIGFSMLDLLVSTMQPFMTISSSMKCAFSRWNIISSSHTLPKCRSMVSTKRCMNSNIASSFSSLSTPTKKNKEA
uniref:Uncharacterized protein n=1 Tax=Rhizophora mucronata TaxID=61149 RepID=A0A2P2JAG9_RHIMU